MKRNPQTIGMSLLPSLFIRAVNYVGDAINSNSSNEKKISILLNINIILINYELCDNERNKMYLNIFIKYKLWLIYASYIKIDIYLV